MMPKGLCGNGEFLWTNRITPRPSEAMEFFGRLLGWTYFEMPRYTDTSFMLGDESVAGLMQITPEMRNVKLYWALDDTVKDADETARQAADLGGHFHVPLKEIPG